MKSKIPAANSRSEKQPVVGLEQRSWAWKAELWLSQAAVWKGYQMDVCLALLLCRDLLLPAQGVAETTACLLLPLYPYLCPQTLLPWDHRLCFWAGLEKCNSLQRCNNVFYFKTELKTEIETQTARPDSPSPHPLPKADCLLLPFPIFCWLSWQKMGVIKPFFLKANGNKTPLASLWWHKTPAGLQGWWQAPIASILSLQNSPHPVLALFQ